MQYVLELRYTTDSTRNIVATTLLLLNNSYVIGKLKRILDGIKLKRFYVAGLPPTNLTPARPLPFAGTTSLHEQQRRA